MHFTRSSFSVLTFCSALAHCSRQELCHHTVTVGSVIILQQTSFLSSFPSFLCRIATMKKKCYFPFGLFETCIVPSSGSANMAFLTVPAFTSGQDYSCFCFFGNSLLSPLQEDILLLNELMIRSFRFILSVPAQEGILIYHGFSFGSSCKYQL